MSCEIDFNPQDILGDFTTRAFTSSVPGLTSNVEILAANGNRVGLIFFAGMTVTSVTPDVPGVVGSWSLGGINALPVEFFYRDYAALVGFAWLGTNPDFVAQDFNGIEIIYRPEL